MSFQGDQSKRSWNKKSADGHKGKHKVYLHPVSTPAYAHIYDTLCGVFAPPYILTLLGLQSRFGDKLFV